VVTDLVVPPEPSPRPKLAEWKSVKPFLGDSGGNASCTARQIREWIFLECSPRQSVAITLFSGPSKEYTATSGGDWKEPAPGEVFATPGSPATILFPLRRGARYQIGLSAGFLLDYQSGDTAVQTVLLISAYWLDEDPSPTIAFTVP
jgi:hypothetical protein